MTLKASGRRSDFDLPLELAQAVIDEHENRKSPDVEIVEPTPPKNDQSSMQRRLNVDPPLRGSPK